MNHVLSVKNLTKIYKGNPPFLAVDGISFHLKQGEILGFLGPNGSGKTTTIQMLLGTLTATSGSIEYFGKDFFKHRTELTQSISFASTYTSLPYILTVEENLNVIGALYGLSAEESRKRSEPLLERFGILPYQKRRVSNLSAGQITRLMLVKAFFIQPKIVLLDEPTASLDPEMSREICEFILQERDQRGVSFLFTSHKMEEVAEVCDRVVFLQSGKIIADDLPENLARSSSRYRLYLTIADGLEKATALADRFNCSYKIEHRVAEIFIEESQIPSFLNALGKSDVNYSTIQIQEPSLEDYFLQKARR